MKRLLLTFGLLLALAPLACANDFYNHGSFPTPSSPATSAAMRAELDLIMAGFDKLPTITGNANKAVIINGAGTALGVTTGGLALGGNLTLSGAFATTITVTGTTTITLPTSGTLVGATSGTWSPSVGGSATYTSQIGTYIKTGKMVFVSCTLIINVLGTGSTNTISGLPFPGGSSPTSDQALADGFSSGLALSVVSLNPTVGATSSTVLLYGRTAASTAASLLGVLGNGAQVNFTGTYRTD